MISNTNLLGVTYSDTIILDDISKDEHLVHMKHLKLLKPLKSAIDNMKPNTLENIDSMIYQDNAFKTKEIGNDASVLCTNNTINNLFVRIKDTLTKIK
jgi:hypothetical protein